MKNIKLYLFFILIITTITQLAHGQCSGCTLNITAPSSATYSLTSNTTVCITGSGSFTGVLNNFNGNTLCIGTSVTYNPSSAPNYNGNWTIINNGTFQNVNNLNFNSGDNFTNAATGTVTFGSINIGCPFINNGTLNATSISANASITLGGTTTISGSLSNSSTLTVTGNVVAGSITNNGTIVGGAGTNCNSIKSTGTFSNPGTIGNTGQYLYVGNTGGSILSPATSTSPTAPASQPTSLILGNTGSTINGSFTQCTSNGYVILRAIAASVPATTNPTNFASLVVGQTIGAWTVAAINSGQATTTFSDNVGATCSNIYYRIYAYNSGGYCRVFNIGLPLTGNYNFTPSITSSTPASNCGTGTATLGAAASAGTINWYATTTGGSSLVTGTSFTTPSIATTTTYYVDATNNGCTTATRTAIIATINSIPTITSSTPGSNCGTGNVTLGGSASAGTINWYAAITGGSSLGSGASFLTPSIATTTTYYIDATNNGCITATRTAVTANINPNLPASVSIVSSATTICTGTSVTFTATPTNGGTTPTYQWKLNGVNATGQTAATFTTTTLANNDSVIVIMTSNATPCLTGSPATSNAIIETVSGISAVGTASSNQTICSGTQPASLTLSSNTGTIQWQYSTDNSTFTNIVGAASSTLLGSTMGTLTTTTYYRAVVTNGVCSSINSNVVTITVSYTPGNFGNSLNLDGTNDFVITPNIAASMSTNDVTVELWFNANTAGVIVDELGQSALNSGWHDSQIEILSTGEVKVRVWALTSVSLGFVTFGSWNHAVIRYNSSTSTLDGLLNGVASASNTVGTRSKSTASGYGYYYAFGGTDTTNLGSGAYFNGTIDEVRIWNTARTNTQIQALMNTELVGNESGLVAYYNINQGIANGSNTGLTTLIDKTANSLNATLNNFALTGTTSNYVGGNSFSISTISGTTSGCIGSTTQLNNTTYGGVWSSSNTAVATINSTTGLVTAVSAGSTTINYTITSDVGCSSSVNISFTVNTPPTITSSTPGTRSGTGVVTLGATASGGTVNWYVATTGGSSLGTGTSFSTPSITTTTTYYAEAYNNGCSSNPRTSVIATVTLKDTDGDGIPDSIDIDDDNDGILDSIECAACISDPFVNGGFETTTPLLGASTYSIMPATNVYGWQTSPETVIEVWSSGFNGGYGPVPAASGNQFVELNANVAGTLYQTFCLNGAAGGTIVWSVKHRGRAGFDQAFVRFGATLALAQTDTPVATMVDGNTAWGTYSGLYNIPAGLSQIIIGFQAGYTATGDPSVGNFLDDVSISLVQGCVDSDGDGIADVYDLDSDNDGIPDIEEAGFKAYSNNTGTMDKTNSTNWKDANGNGMNDYIDAMITAGTYTVPDTDGDGIRNQLDLDSDNDSLFDVDEGGMLNGDGDINDDGKGDGIDTDGDGILDAYDNSSGYGTIARAYAQDTDNNGIPDFLQLDSNSDGTFDIQTGLYGSFDANNDGKIDGATDIDKDGILDSFDTNTSVTGSPRNLNRKLELDFDGRNDYAEDSSILGGLANASLMAWIDLNSTFSTDGVIVGQDKFQIRVTSAKKLEVAVNSTTLTYNTVTLNTSQWYHVAAVYGGGLLKLYLNGNLVASQSLSGSIASDPTKLTLGRNPLSSAKYFKGKMDEIRVFNVALNDAQVQRMVYQEIQNTSSQVRGTIVPKDVGSLPFTNLLRYFKMDTYKDDIVDDLTTTTVDTGTGMKLYNHKNIYVQQAPMPFVTLRAGTFATAVNDSTNDIRGLDIMDQDWSIVQVKHNITETANNVDLGMTVDPSVTITMNNDTKIQNDWYLKLDGSLVLSGKSQLVETINSDLDVTSAGFIKRDQQGQSNKYDYNYWSSPVGPVNTTSNNNNYTVDGVMKDGTSGTAQNITWTTSVDGSPTSPITLSNRWIYKFQNVSNSYANWTSLTQTSPLAVAQGFTLKGSGAATATQNYTFVGKPNNAAITTTVASTNLNLCGNPYPSAIDANAFITVNSTAITGTLYFWQHSSTNNTHVLSGYQGGYAAINLTGGIAPVAPSLINGLGSSAKVPKRYIPVGQGFFVVGSAVGGTITFDNSIRGFIKEDDAVNSTTLFKNSTTIPNQNSLYYNAEDVVATDTFKRVRIGMKSTDNYYRQILLGFMENNATEGYDVGYDGINIDTQLNDMYFMNSGLKLNIQGVGYFDATKSYPLGIKANSAGVVNISLDNTENIDTNQNVYIFDATTGEYHDITTTPYSVSLPQGLTENRFSLTFTDNTTLTSTNYNLQNGITIAYANSSSVLSIKNNIVDTTIEQIKLYNMLGQEVAIYSVKDQNQQNILVPIKNFSTGTYIVKVKTDKGDTERKIVFN